MPFESHVDVLIIGAGPAGLMCANALAAAGEDFRIIDQRPLKVPAGQADGFAPRTVEVLQSYGLAERLLRMGNHCHMTSFYSPGPDGGIQCTRRSPVVTVPDARYPFALTLPQSGIETIFLDALKDRGIEVERPKEPSALEILDESSSSYPVKVTVERLDGINENKTEIIHAKFLVGADGAHSWVRKTLGIAMEGEHTDHIWGVVDAVFKTNFPDIRTGGYVQSQNGSCLIVPREDDKDRFYIQLSDTDIIDPSTGKVDKSKMSPERLLSAAQKIMHPYELDYAKEIDWWTTYIVGQRVASSYSFKNRIFIAGDACHTHSPKAGQGMNASINDIHNLAWKLVQVLRGWSNPTLLNTYEQERRKFAQDLINFDRDYAAKFSGKVKSAGNEDGVSPEELSRTVRKHASFLTGLGIQYSPSAIVDPKHQKCSETLAIGQRMLPQIFVQAADIRPVELQDLLPADIRFKLLFFAGNLTPSRITELNLLAEELSKPSGFLRKYSPHGDISTTFEIITIVAGKKADVNFNYLLVPPFFRPHWTRVLMDDTDITESRGGRAYEKFGIDPEQITIVVVRPDGYVGTIVPSTAIADLDDYFGSFMVSH